MSRRLATAVLIVAAAATILALGRFSHPRADEDEEEKPIASSAAQVFRNAAGNVVIALPPATQSEIGLTVKTLEPVMRPVEIEAYGAVLDPAPLSVLNSDLISARAALDAAAAEYRRSRQLYSEQKNVSLRDLQTTQATYLTDKARLDALAQQLRNAWGSEISQMEPQARSALIGDLVARRQAIIRVTVPAGTIFDGLPVSAEIVALGHEEHPLSVKAVYYAPMVDSRMQGEGFLLLTNPAEFPVPAGTAVSAYLSASTAQHGVVIPRSAVVRYAGKQWIYLELDGSKFMRTPVANAQSGTDGYFVTGGLEAGARVVVAGAQTLLSEELKAQIRPSD